MLWNHIPNDRDADNKPLAANATADPTAAVKSLVEKRTMIGLIHAYAVAVKHMLRGEPGVYYEDLYPLISFLPKYSIPPAPGTVGSEEDMLPIWRASEMVLKPHERSRAASPELKASGSDAGTSMNNLNGTVRTKRSKAFDPEKVLPSVESDRPLRPARNPPKTSVYDFLPFLRIFKPLFTKIRGASAEDEGGHRSLLGHKKYVAHVESNVPLEITLYMSSYLSWLLKKGLLTPALATGIMNNITSLQDCAVSLARIRNTPLPFAYQAHLRMSLWLYLFFLPFEVYSAFKYLTIPATAFASFLLLGFLEIGQEIENPFNYDLNDLDLDGFCLQIQREIAQITAHTMPTPDQFVFSVQNQPFAPGDRRTAAEIVRDSQHDYHHPEAGMNTLRKTMLKSWADIDAQTREHNWQQFGTSQQI
jgi:predicted membrane chloride channel (bestrophin family)